MRSVPQRLWARLGRRGVALSFFGLVDLVYAFSLFNPLPPTRQGTAQEFVETVAPLWMWGLLWLIAGLLCVVQAWMRKDQYGFAAAIMVKSVWGTMYLIGGLLGQIDRAYVAVVIWLALAGFVAVISSWPEPPPIRPILFRADPLKPPRGSENTEPL